MRILANENTPASAIEALREHGHDVPWMRTESPGSPDEEVLRMAVSQERLLITFDKDFGELAVREGLPATCGVVLFRIRPTSPSHIAHRVVTALDSQSDWSGHFSVVESHRIRMIPLRSRET